MATSEKTFQAELLKAMHALDWHAFKVTSIGMAGIPDLYVKAPHKQGTWIELKFETWTDSMYKNGVPVNATKLQRHFIEREQAEGGAAGIIVCIAKPAKYPVNWFACVIKDPFLTLLPLQDVVTGTIFYREKGSGQPWNVKGMLDAL